MCQAAFVALEEELCSSPPIPFTTTPHKITAKRAMLLLASRNRPSSRAKSIRAKRRRPGKISAGAKDEIGHKGVPRHVRSLFLKIASLRVEGRRDLAIASAILRCRLQTKSSRNHHKPRDWATAPDLICFWVNSRV